MKKILTLITLLAIQNCFALQTIRYMFVAAHNPYVANTSTSNPYSNDPVNPVEIQNGTTIYGSSNGCAGPGGVRIGTITTQVLWNGVWINSNSTDLIIPQGCESQSWSFGSNGPMPESPYCPCH